MRPSVKITLREDERSELERLARGRKVWRGLSDRAHIVLLAAEGLTNVQIGTVLGVTDQTARKWRNRFAEHRMDGLEDEPRSGRPRRIDDDSVAEVVRKTLEERPRDATQWSARSMARATGYAPSTIHRIWQAFSLQPHRSETFKLSADPYFVDKTRDIVGLYVDPPQHALALCVDEKSQVQALDRTQPLLPLRTSTLIAASPRRWWRATTPITAMRCTARPIIFNRCPGNAAATMTRLRLNDAARSLRALRDAILHALREPGKFRRPLEFLQYLLPVVDAKRVWRERLALDAGVVRVRQYLHPLKLANHVLGAIARKRARVEPKIPVSVGKSCGLGLVVTPIRCGGESE